MVGPADVGGSWPEDDDDAGCSMIGNGGGLLGGGPCTIAAGAVAAKAVPAAVAGPWP